MSRAKRARLGRGLGALLGEDYLDSSDPKAEGATLPLERIVPNPFQPRREFREEELADLSRSIAENGLLQPLVVRPAPDGKRARYELVAGERRLRAVTGLGWSDVPVVVRDVDDRTLLVLALVENLQREALSPLEEAEGYQALSKEFGLTQGEIADAVGKNRATVANMLRLLRLPPSIRTLVEENALSMGHARALLAVEDPGRLVELGRRAAREGWTVRQVEERARAGGSGSGGRRSHAGRRRDGTDPVVRALRKALEEALGAKVTLRGAGKGRGAIEVSFSSPDDFERVFELITGRDASEVTG